MVVLMVVAACYGVLQLALLGSFTRSVRVSTLLLAVVGSCYGCGMLALLIQVAYSRVVAAASGQPSTQVVETASYTVDPFVEEVVKLAPLVAILLLAPRLRRQWGYVDFLLVGAATGAGFALAEALLRYSGRAARAIGDGDGGYLVPIGLSVPHVRGLGALLTSWLPAPVEVIALLGDNQDVNFHLGWSAVAGLGAGFLVLTRGRRRLLGLLPLLWAGMDHAAANRSIAGPGTGVLQLLLNGLDALRAALPALVLLALVAATVVDLRALRPLRHTHPELQLARERSGTPSVVILTRAAMAAPPWTPVLVARFVLARRAVRRELTRLAAGSEPPPLAVAVTLAADQLDWATNRREWPAWSWQRLRPTARSTRQLLRNWRVLLWLVLLAPAVLYLVVGAVPALSGVQTLLASRPVFALLGVLTAAGVVFAIWQVVNLLRQLPAVVRQGANDPLLRLVSRLGAGTGAAVGGTALVIGWLTGAHGTDHVGQSFHILDALSLLSYAAGIALVLAAFIFFPPLGMVVLAEGGIMLVTTAAAGEFALAATTGVALGGLGTLLNEAADANRSTSRATSPQAAPAAGTEGSGRVKGLNLDPVTRAKIQAKLPPDWGPGRATRKGVGTRWFGQKPERDGVRVDKAVPESDNLTQHVDHVIVRHNGKVLDPAGQPIPGRIDQDYESHIPLADWLKWRFWWKP